MYFAKNKHLEILNMSCNGLQRSGVRRLKELIRLNT